MDKTMTKQTRDKRAIRRCNSKGRQKQYNGKTDKGQKTNRLLDKILSKKLKIEEHKPHLESGMNSKLWKGKQFGSYCSLFRKYSD